jgi:hypothetical protein
MRFSQQQRGLVRFSLQQRGLVSTEKLEKEGHCAELADYVCMRFSQQQRGLLGSRGAERLYVCMRFSQLVSSREV